jgi:hypothetical protein
MELLQIWLSDVTEMLNKKYFLLLVFFLAILLELTIAGLFGAQKSFHIGFPYLLAFFIRLLIVSICVFYLPYFLISFGVLPRRKKNTSVEFEAVLREYRGYSDPLDIELVHGSKQLKRTEKYFGVDALSLRYAVRLKSFENQSKSGIKISPWHHDYEFKNEEACFKALGEFKKSKHPSYFFLLPWISFSSVYLSVRGKLIYWFLLLAFMLIYSVIVLNL